MEEKNHLEQIANLDSEFRGRDEMGKRENLDKVYEIKNYRKSQSSKGIGWFVLGLVISLFAGATLGLSWPAIRSGVMPYLGFAKAEYNNWNELDRLYQMLSYYYDGEIDKSLLIEGAKKGMVEALGDKYTLYMDDKEAADFEKSLHGDVGAGVGIEMGVRDKYVKVIRTLPNNPARKAGMLAGDILFKVNGEEVWSLTPDKIGEKIRGQAGTKVSVTIIRDQEEKTFEMVREKINNVSVEITYENKIAIIRTTRFDQDTGKQIAEAAKAFREKGLEKVILDLRYNGGGYVDAAIDMLSLWIDGEKVLIQKSKPEGEKVSYAKRGVATLKDFKTIVLVNGSSASASEIVAGALKDYKKATIVGEKTFGKGVVQSLRNLNDGALLKVTTAKWYTPSGKSINKEGITPDIEVVNTFNDANSGKDPQMEKAKKMLE